MKTIAVDLDDVLSASVPGFLAYSNKRWGTALNPDNYDEDWTTMWGIDLSTTEDRARDLYAANVFQEYEPYKEAESTLQRLSKDHHLVIVTSRRREIEQTTHEWLERHFKGIFNDVYFAGIWDTITEQSKLRTKRSICERLNAQHLIDDQVKHCNAVAEGGITTLLYGDYAWNRDAKVHGNVKRVQSWQDVEEFFYGGN